MGGLHKPLMLTGLQPSGPLMIANYIGARKDWMRLQATHEPFLMIADLHALTVPQNPDALRRRPLEFVALFAACGIEMEKSVVFMQSHVSAHTQLLWVWSSRGAWLANSTRPTARFSKSRRPTRRKPGPA